MMLLRNCSFLLILVSASNATRLIQNGKRATPTSCTTAAASPTPRRLHCGIEGREKNMSPITQSTSSYSDCQASCLNNPSDCVSFSYGPNDQCTTYDKKIIASHFRKGPSGRKYYNRHCFEVTCGLCPDGQRACGGDCIDTTSDPNNCGGCGNQCGNGASCNNSQCTCPQGSGLCSGPFGPCQDLTSDDQNCGSCGNYCGLHSSCSNSKCQCQLDQSISNPGFESGDLGAWNFQPMTDFFGEDDTALRFPNDPSTAYDGDYYADIYCTDEFEGAVNFALTQTVPICRNTPYTLTLHTSSQCPFGACTCAINACVGGACKNFDPPGGSSPNSPVSFNFTSGSSDQAAVSVAVGGFFGNLCERNYVRFDGFSLVPRS